MFPGLLCLLLAFFLHGCGLKGPLYLPTPEQEREMAEREQRLREREQRELEEMRRPRPPPTAPSQPPAPEPGVAPPDQPR
jgi:predicted small lipoprotein YifL